MPIRPKPFTFVCDTCGWKKTIAPLSDALGPGEWMDKCPKCGSNELRVRPAGPVEKALAQMWLRF